MRHKSNYITPLSHYIKANGKTNTNEVDFQISLKKLFLKPTPHTKLYFGYTQKSFWELYDKKNSSPFRETNYNPELFLDIDIKDKPLFLDTIYLGYEHESNGQSVLKSRSWNRYYTQGFIEKGNFNFNLKIWNRVPEVLKLDINDTNGDDNPEIVKYYGNSEINFSYKYKESKFSLFLRNLESAFDKKSFITSEFTYNYSTGEDIDIIVKYFSGYGDSLIDYDEHIEKISIGFEVY